MPRNKMSPSFEQNKENILTCCPFGQAYPIVVYRKLLQTPKKKPKTIKWTKWTTETGQGIQKKVKFYFLARFYP